MKIIVPLLSLFVALALISSCASSIDNTVPKVPTVEDIDGNVYRTVVIGDQVWMAENLRVTHYRDGKPIPHVEDANVWRELDLADDTPTVARCDAYCAYDNNDGNVETYGLLYNWEVISLGDVAHWTLDSVYHANVAPEGWHVPTDDEWKTLEMYLGMTQPQADGEDVVGYGYWGRGFDEGSKLKEKGFDHWVEFTGIPYGGYDPIVLATDEVGFTALPGGMRYYDGDFPPSLELYGYFWTATSQNSSPGGSAYYRMLGYANQRIWRTYFAKRDGYSIRCVKD